jgi:hypothetical protein
MGQRAKIELELQDLRIRLERESRGGGGSGDRLQELSSRIDAKEQELQAARYRSQPDERDR